MIGRKMLKSLMPYGLYTPTGLHAAKQGGGAFTIRRNVHDKERMIGLLLRGDYYDRSDVARRLDKLRMEEITAIDLYSIYAED